MPDPLEQVLRLVAEGRLTAAEAEPILDALNATAERPAGSSAVGSDEPPAAGSGAGPAALRIEVKDGGRQVINLRIPISLGRFAVERIPGLSESTSDLVRQALSSGRRGNLLEVDDDGDTVRISLE
jgi:hypothetical protein